MQADYIQALESNVSKEQLNAFLALPGRFQMKDPNTGDYVPYQNEVDDWKGYDQSYLKPRLGGELIHTERSGFDPKKSESIDILKKYISTTIKSYVKNAIDVYFDAKRKGIEENYSLFVTYNLGACMEDKIKNYINYRQENLDDGVVDVNFAAHLDNIVNGNEAQNQKELIEAELQLLMTEDPDGGWEDYAPLLHEKLEGKYSTVIVANKN